MSQNPPVDKTIVARAVISKIEDEQKPEKIWAKHVPGYASPEKIPEQEDDQGKVPDIATRRAKGIDIYEIELDDMARIKKWRSFARYAKEHNGGLTLVVPGKYLPTLKQQVIDNDIVAQFIYFDTE